MRYGLILITLLALTPAVGFADLYNCNGRWTNKPCTGHVKSVLKELPPSEPSPEASDLSKRRSWIHELVSLRIRAKKEHDIDANTDIVEDLCLNQQSTLSDCGDAISLKEQELQNLIVAKEQLKIEKEKSDKVADQPQTINIVRREDHRRFIIINKPSKELEGKKKPHVEVAPITSPHFTDNQVKPAGPESTGTWDIKSEGE